MKSILLKSALFAAAIAVSQAATINVGQGFGTNVGVVAQDSTGTALSAGGYYISVGSYTTVPTVVSGNAASLLSAVNSFNIFATSTSPLTAAGATAGSIVGAFTSIGAPDATLFNLKNIYFVIGNGATKALSTDFGIFNVVTSFPADVTQSGATAVTLSAFSSFTPLANAGTAVDLVGAKDGFKLVTTVPEPSAALVGAIGALGLLRRRRN